METLIDTQVLSTHFKASNNGISSSGSCISSITANEFLWVYKKGSSKPAYYIVHPARFSGMKGVAHSIAALDHFKNKKWAMQGARRTDQIIIDFNNQFPAYKEFGLEAIATIINEQQLNIFDMSIAHIEKKKRRYLRERIRFVINSQYTCVPPNEPIVTVAMGLFARFTEKYSLKEDIRNSINDIIILATAIEKQIFLISEDSLLSRFAAKECNAVVKKVRGILEIDFSATKSTTKRFMTESKGYINKGWSYSVRNGNSVFGG